VSELLGLLELFALVATNQVIMNVFGRDASALPIVVVFHFYRHLLWCNRFRKFLMMMMMISFATAFQSPEGTRSRYQKGLPTPKRERDPAYSLDFIGGFV